MILKLCLKANNIKKKAKILSFVKKKLKKVLTFKKFGVIMIMWSIGYNVLQNKQEIKTCYQKNKQQNK